MNDLQKTYHTPGPWTFDGGYLTTPSGTIVTHRIEPNRSIQPTEEERANSLLMSAAPDMLEALQEAERELSKLDKDPFIDDALTYIRHGIKKATGK
jgi:hypothetical protein